MRVCKTNSKFQMYGMSLLEGNIQLQKARLWGAMEMKPHF